MRLTALPQTFKEAIALVAGIAPTPLMDTLVALLLAKTVIAATGVGIFDALGDAALTTAEIAERCGSNPRATEKLLRALVACKYLKCRDDRFTLASASRRWISNNGPLHSAIVHVGLDLRFMNFEEYVKHGKSQEFHSAPYSLLRAGLADLQTIKAMAERVGFELRLSNEINKLGGANGTSNLHNSTKTINSTFYWTLNGR
jgi:hypothetical protein